jgi:hypothetical protein
MTLIKLIFCLFLILAVNAAAQETKAEIYAEKEIILFLAQLNDHMLNLGIEDPFTTSKDDLKLAFKIIPVFSKNVDLSPFTSNYSVSQVAYSIEVYKKCLPYVRRTDLKNFIEAFSDPSYGKFKEFAYSFSKDKFLNTSNLRAALFDFCRVAVLTGNKSNALEFLLGKDFLTKKDNRYKADIILAIYCVLLQKQISNVGEVLSNALLECIVSPKDLEVGYEDVTIRHVLQECILQNRNIKPIVNRLAAHLISVWQRNLKQCASIYVDDLVFLFNNNLSIGFCLSEFARLLDGKSDDPCSVELVYRIDDDLMPVAKDVDGLELDKTSEAEIERLIKVLQNKNLLHSWKKNNETKYVFEVIAQLALKSNSYPLKGRTFDKFIDDIINDQAFNYLPFGQSDPVLSQKKRTFFDRLLQLGNELNRNVSHIATRVKEAMQIHKFSVDDALRFGFLADKYQQSNATPIVDSMITAIVYNKQVTPIKYFVFNKTNNWLTDLRQYAGRGNAQALKALDLLKYYFFTRNQNGLFAYIHSIPSDRSDFLWQVTESICNFDNLRLRCLPEFTQKIRYLLADSLDVKELSNPTTRTVIDSRTRDWFDFVEKKAASVQLLEKILNQAVDQKGEVKILVTNYWKGVKKLLLKLVYIDNLNSNHFVDKPNRIKQLFSFASGCKRSKMTADVVDSVFIYLPNQDKNIISSNVKVKAIIDSLDNSQGNAFYNLRNEYVMETKDMLDDSAHIWGLSQIALSSRNSELCGKTFDLFMNRYKGKNKLDRIINFVFSMPNDIFWNSISTCINNLSEIIELPSLNQQSPNTPSQEKGCPKGHFYKDNDGYNRICFSFDDLKDIRRLGPTPLHPVNVLRMKTRMEEAMKEIKQLKTNTPEYKQRNDYLSQIWQVFLMFLNLSDSEVQRITQISNRQRRSMTIAEEAYVAEHEAALYAFLLIWAPHNLNLSVWNNVIAGTYARNFFHERALYLTKKSSAELDAIKLSPKQLSGIFDYNERIQIKLNIKNFEKFPDKFLAKELSFLLKIGAAQADRLFITDLLIPVFSDRFKNANRISDHFNQASPRATTATIISEIYSQGIPVEHAKFAIQNLSTQSYVGRWVCYAITNQALESQIKLTDIDLEALRRSWEKDGDVSLRVLATWFRSDSDWQLFADLLRMPWTTHSNLIDIVFNNLEISERIVTRKEEIEINKGTLCGNDITVSTKVTKCSILKNYLKYCLKISPTFSRRTFEFEDSRRGFYVFKNVTNNKKYKDGEIVLQKCK